MQKHASIRPVALVLSCVLLAVSHPGAPAAQQSRRGSAQQIEQQTSRGRRATLLGDGRWLLTGGEDAAGSIAVWDPVTGTVEAVGTLLTGRAWHSATALPDGSVLIFGGLDAQGRTVAAPERFDPRSRRVEAMDGSALAPRARHTATVVSDGRVLLAGGVDGRLLDDADLWDPARPYDVPSSTILNVPRRDHRATLLSDGRVLLEEGIDGRGESAGSAEAFVPDAQMFVQVEGAPVATLAQVAESAPADGAVGVAPDARVWIRLSRPAAVQTINGATIRVSAADREIATRISIAEEGRLVFVTPAHPLEEGASYTVAVAGVEDPSGTPVPENSFSFRIRDKQRETESPDVVDDEAWTPAEGNGWQTGRARSPWESMPLPQAPPGVTALAGRVLRLNGKPLADVTLHLGTATAQSDAAGRFLLSDVPSGRVELVVDARTANQPGKTYGFFMIAVDVDAKRTTPLPFSIWMPLLDTQHATSLPSPTMGDMIVTTPRIQGLEVHIPPGVRLKDPEGQVVTSMTITPIPIDRPPFPLPRGVQFPTYFTLQPGGAAIEAVPGQPDKNLKLVFPNGGRAPAGSRIDFWSYDSKSIGWFVYGQGSVTADGRRIVPDAGVRIRMFTCASVGNPTTAPSPSPAPCNGSCDGDPVDLGTGLFVYEKTDLLLPDVIPIVMTRTHRSKDPLPRPFGIGVTHAYELFIVGEKIGMAVGQWVDVVLPDGGRIHFERLPPPNDQIFEHVGTPSGFYKSRLVLTGDFWHLTLTDGTVYEFRVDWALEIVVLQSITDRFGNKLTILRDVNHRITKIFSPNGRWVEFLYNGTGTSITQLKDSLGRTVGYTYDASGRLWKVTDAKNGVTEFGYNTSHHITSIKDPRNITYLTNTYDVNARVSKQTQADGSVYRFAYTTDLSGKITQTEVTDPRGVVRRVTFNPSGYWLTDIRGLGLAEQQSTTVVREPGSNVIQSEIDALNRETTYGYDANKNRTRVTRLANTAQPVTSEATYTGFGEVETVTDPLTHRTTFGYDSRGALTSITDPLNHQVAMVPDTAGRPSSTTDFAGTMQFAYAAGDFVSVTNGLGHTTQRFLDAGGREVSRTNALGNTAQAQYDALSQPLRLTDALQGETDLSYDANGNLESVTDAREGRTEYTYDVMDRVETRTDPLLRVDRYAYDLNGNLTQVADRKGQVTIHTYDPLNRRTLTTWPDGSSTQYTYDAGNRLRQVIDAVTGTTTLDYDDLDRLTSESNARGTVTYGYDAADRRRSMTVAGQPAVIYDYDDADRLTTITQGSSVVTLEYDNADRRTALELPNGVRVEYGYNAASQLTGLTYMLGGTTLGSLTYAYDAAGRRTEMAGTWARTSLPSAVASASYDAANRLTSWNGDTLTYDDDGNLLTDGSRSFGWDARNRLSAVGGQQPASFQYDAFGRRTSKSVPSGTTEYLYDGPEAVQELAGGSPSANLMYGSGIDELLLRSSGATARWLLADGLGSALALLDPAGAVQTQYTYGAFGATSATGEASTNAAQYTGRENDGTGLYYYRARYYSPGLQRFVSEDPLVFESGDSNLYLYVADNPTNAIDPFGLYSWGAFERDGTNAVAGFGDTMSLTATDLIREHYDLNAFVNKCSNAYRYGSWVATGVGLSRLAYAGIAKGASFFASSGTAASQFRSRLKVLFGGNPKMRSPDLSKYKTDQALREAAGRTNLPTNAYGAGVTASGLLGGRPCGCSQ